MNVCKIVKFKRKLEKRKKKHLMYIIAKNVPCSFYQKHFLVILCCSRFMFLYAFMSVCLRVVKCFSQNIYNFSKNINFEVSNL